ncbi:SusD/RagB family nutrient-binding outer membrane lipoprotein [uncultured Algibacter sp.]|uniref:SusD/RagB family nutrient-binding outer membrane lipoprotein n=1 Tax=uncultured Algibacter sp. TaxID=298659 RepID=UPI002606B32A|nr:SusD/RagB family nutrient-binding outer membrane lipoprotein [uncultured Algibacter sp.]
MKKAITLMLSVFITLVSCTDDFEEINTRKDAIVTPEAGQLFTTIVTVPVYNYQRNVNLFADFYSQYWANTVSGFESGRYEYVDGWIGNMWREWYTIGLSDIRSLQRIYREDPTYNNLMQVLEIWEASEWTRMTDQYGDIPYFGAGVGEVVPYNSQQEIYYDLFDRITAAVNAIDSNDSSQIGLEKNESQSISPDLIFRWDLEKWKRFGNSLRLRMAMRISNIDPGKAQTEAIAAINAGVMQSNADVAQIPAWNRGFYDYLRNMAVAWDNIRCSKTFLDFMYSETSMEDPRAKIWFAYKESSSMFGADRLEGVANGYNILPVDANDHATMNADTNYVGFSGDGGEIDHYQPIMLYTEVLFLQAEAALRGWGAGDANALMLEGVRASMEFVGVDPADATAYINELPALSGSNEAKLKQLITQKYISNFPNGKEAWADFRRTDYPDLTLPLDGVSSAASVASGTWVKRIRYPDNAHELEQQNMPAGQNTIDSDRMDIRLWWDTADTKTKSDGLMNSNF